MDKHIVFSGIQPTGTLHLGNYLGAVKQWLPLQDQHQCFFCIVDLHALTVPQDPKDFPQHVFDAALDYLALGLNPEKAVIYVQSHVPEHVELMWLLNTLTPFGELQRMTQWKDKAKKTGETISQVSAGLLNYPILMAADILLYKAAFVPIGDDQRQHLEFTRLIARKFNNRFGETFPLPEARFNATKRIMSLVDPSVKMSKSHGPASFLALSDSPEIITRKIAKAVTATAGGKDNPGVANLLAIFREVGDPNVVKHFEEQERDGTIHYAELKKTLADAINEHLAPYRTQRTQLEKKRKYVEEIFHHGAEQAQKAAAATMAEVRAKVGLTQP